MLTLARLTYKLGRILSEIGNAQVLSAGAAHLYGFDTLLFDTDKGMMAISEDVILPEERRYPPLPEWGDTWQEKLPEDGNAVFVVVDGPYPFHTCHTYGETRKAFARGQSLIWTTCLEAFSTRTLLRGYRLFAVFGNGESIEVQIGRTALNGEIVSCSSDLKAMLLAGAFFSLGRIVPNRSHPAEAAAV